MLSRDLPPRQFSSCYFFSFSFSRETRDGCSANVRRTLGQYLANALRALRERLRELSRPSICCQFGSARNTATKLVPHGWCSCAAKQADQLTGLDLITKKHHSSRKRAHQVQRGRNSSNNWWTRRLAFQSTALAIVQFGLPFQADCAATKQFMPLSMMFSTV